MSQAPGYEARAETRFQAMMPALSRLSADHSRAALGTRNLLEPRYWTSYAAGSEANIRRIHQDALIDARDMLDKFTAICTLRPELAQVGPIIDQARSRFDQQCAQHGLTARPENICV